MAGKVGVFKTAVSAHAALLRRLVVLMAAGGLVGWLAVGLLMFWKIGRPSPWVLMPGALSQVILISAMIRRSWWKYLRLCVFIVTCTGAITMFLMNQEMARSAFAKTEIFLGAIVLLWTFAAMLWICDLLFQEERAAASTMRTPD